MSAHNCLDSTLPRVLRRAAAQLTVLTFTALAFAFAGTANAQGIDGWQTELIEPAVPAPAPKTIPAPAKTTPTTKQKPNNPQAETRVRLRAFLTADGQQIDRGLVWRVFPGASEANDATKPIHTYRSATPNVRLEPGAYVVNAAFGRAHLTRKITVVAGTKTTEKFVINAGGLRVKAVTGNGPIPAKGITYDIWEGERDQSGNRALVMQKAQSDLIIRLNAGIYHLVSTYGRANAKVSADVTVEAGKLTEATIQHIAARVTFKLVDRRGGEAIPGTRWQIQTMEGKKVKSSVGALPTHILAPGNYIATAQISGRVFRREFSVSDGDRVQVEVVQQ